MDIETEADHFEVPVCSHWFDVRDLVQVAGHIHDGNKIEFKERDRRPANGPCTK
jgi:hypothetical protein